jgi:hypothetical protein
MGWEKSPIEAYPSGIHDCQTVSDKNSPNWSNEKVGLRIWQHFFKKNCPKAFKFFFFEKRLVEFSSEN